MYRRNGFARRRFRRKPLARRVATKRPTARNQKRQIGTLARQVSTLRRHDAYERIWVNMLKSVSMPLYLRQANIDGVTHQMPYNWFPLTDIINYTPEFEPLDGSSHRRGPGSFWQQKKCKISSMKVSLNFSSNTLWDPCLITVLIVKPRKCRSTVFDLDLSEGQYPFKAHKDYVTNLDHTVSPPVPINDIFTINKQLWSVLYARRFILGSKGAIVSRYDPSAPGTPDPPPEDSNILQNTAKFLKIKLKTPKFILDTYNSDSEWASTPLAKLPYFQRYYVLIFSSNPNTTHYAPYMHAQANLTCHSL